MECDISEVKEEIVPVAEESSNIQLCFRSLEEANAYIRNYEISSNNKFVVIRRRSIVQSDLTSLDKHRLYFDLLSVFGEKSYALSDGIPFANLGYEYRNCQYGHYREKNRNNRKNREDEAALRMGIIRKKRKVGPSKKLGCPAALRIKTVLKFPDFYLDEKQLKSQYARKSCLEKLRTGFCEETKRYIVVYVIIDTNHNHVPKPEIPRLRDKTVTHKIDKGCNRIQDDPIPPFGRGPVLKRSASLMGKDLSDLALQFKIAQELPTQLARPKTYLGLDSMDTHQLLTLYHEITGKVPNDMFVAANKEFTRENFLLLLHLCIVFANAASDEQTHPSVRIKGTENDFTPVECFEADCAITDLHMHCPFCPRTDSYSDVALLKAHYTKQHINKALEFSGLKILRCYDTCEVVTRHTDCKTFKGGHWHCYNCTSANGGRVECLDHFKRHLSAYACSFQIRVAKDVNPGCSSFGTVIHEIENADASLHMETSAATSSLQYSPSKQVIGQSPSKRRYVDTGLGVHDTLNNSVLYVEEDELGNVLSTYTAQEIPTAGEESVVVTYNDRPDVNQLKSRIRELEIQNRQLKRDNSVQKSLIDFLQKQNSDEAETHKLEKERLLAENALLKGETFTEDSCKADNGEEAAGSFLSSGLLSSRTCQKKFQTKNKESSVKHSDPVNKVSDQLSGLKKEIEDLKSALHGNLSTGMNFGTKPVAQNTPIYFIPDQRMMLPYQYSMIPQNVTGLANTNPQNACKNVKTFYNTTAVSLSSSDTPEKIQDAFPVTTVAPTTVLPDTETTLASSVSTEKPSTSSTEATKSDQELKETDSSDASLDNTKNSSAESLETEVQGTTDASETAADASVLHDADRIDATVEDTETFRTDSGDMEIGDDPEISETDVSSAPAVTIPVESDATDTSLNNSELSSAGVQASDTPETSSAGIISSDKDTFNGEEMFIATVLRTEESTASENEKKDSLNSVNIATTDNAIQSTRVGSLSTETRNTGSSFGVNDKGIGASDSSASSSSSVTTNVQNMLQPTVGLQNIVPVMLFPNQNFINPFIQPQKLPGFVNTLPLNPLQGTGVANSLILNSPQNAPASQNTGPFVMVQSQNGAFWIPQNRISGLDKVPGLITSTDINPLNTQEQTSVTDLVNTDTTVKDLLKTGIYSKKSVITGTVDKDLVNNETKSKVINRGSIDDRKSDLKSSVATKTADEVPLKTVKIITRTLAKETNKKGSLTSTDQQCPPNSSLVNTKTPERESKTSEQPNQGPVNTRSSTKEHVKTKITNIRLVNTRSSSKGSSNTETPVKSPLITRSSNKGSESTGALNKGQVNTRSSSDASTEEKSITLHSISVFDKSGGEAALGSVNTETAASLQSNKKSVIVLKVKGNLSKKSLSDFLKKNQKSLKNVNKMSQH
ncbi:uncharacterized protein LOC123533369 [Mercenaria mercenaria]|uniref:uncharacterized protein LOC123533369 n=1 Tax=Mercenaria mercenaria TaxID=6596 RepID=UPI00234E5E48|nr:uncharacterized protein LOC123533369 [Mercenaria mercenaria]